MVSFSFLVLPVVPGGGGEDPHQGKAGAQQNPASDVHKPVAAPQCGVEIAEVWILCGLNTQHWPETFKFSGIELENLHSCNRL